MPKRPTRADGSWIDGFRQQYETWFAEAQALIEAHQTWRTWTR